MSDLLQFYMREGLKKILDCSFLFDFGPDYSFSSGNMDWTGYYHGCIAGLFILVKHKIQEGSRSILHASAMNIPFHEYKTYMGNFPQKAVFMQLSRSSLSDTLKKDIIEEIGDYSIIEKTVQDFRVDHVKNGQRIVKLMSQYGMNWYKNM